jgi:hypothetical protein
MKALFSTNDWLARHEGICLLLIALLICLSGAFQ